MSDPDPGDDSSPPPKSGEGLGAGAVRSGAGAAPTDGPDGDAAPRRRSGKRGRGSRSRERDPSLPPLGFRSGGGRLWEREALAADRSLRGVQALRAPDYVVVGQIVADLLPDGGAVLGGTALYSALTAARLGWRVGVLTRGRYGTTVDGIEVPPLDPFLDELNIVAQAAETPTVFVNEYQGGRRTQTIRRWAGEIDLRGLPPHWLNAKVIHLGPVAQEIDVRQVAGLNPRFLGATPQGWMRAWPEQGGRVRLTHLRLPADFLGRLDAVVVSDEEIGHAREVVDWVGARRLGVITLGEQGASVVFGGERADLPGFPVKTRDLTGAGDVFAAAFFTKAADRTVSAVDAGRFANAVAALSLQGVGPAAVPTRAEADALLATNADQRPTLRR